MQGLSQNFWEITSGGVIFQYKSRLQACKLTKKELSSRVFPKHYVSQNSFSVNHLLWLLKIHFQKACKYRINYLESMYVIPANSHVLTFHATRYQIFVKFGLFILFTISL